MEPKLTILDIDYDVFFYPVKAKGDGIDYIDDVYEFNKRTKKCLNVETLYNAFKFNSNEINVFDNHDEVYYFLKSKGISNSKLVHVDAHSDFITYYPENNVIFDQPVAYNNYIFKLVSDKVVDEVNWIHQNKLTSEDVDIKFNVNNEPVRFTKNKIRDVHDLKVDIILWSRSFDFCPDGYKNDNLLNEFIKLLKKHN